MPKLRKLWKGTQGWANPHEGPAVHPPSVQRPESMAKVYSIYIPNNVAVAQSRRQRGQDAYDHTDVWVDERDGRGWQLYERIQHATDI